MTIGKLRIDVKMSRGSFPVDGRTGPRVEATGTCPSVPVLPVSYLHALHEALTSTPRSF